MRERAEAAIESPWSGPDQFGVITSADPEVQVHGEDCGCGGGIGNESTAEHIASWHPAVALAVAGWLEHVSRIAEAKQCEPGDMVSALAVARAYLGEVTE